MKTLVCLDIGAKVIGVAVAHGSVAFPQQEIAWGGDVDVLRRWIKELGGTTVIVGLPQKPAPAMQQAYKTVVEELQAQGIVVIPVDEHVSTQEAANRIADIEEETGARFTGRRDSVAAQIILERYLAQS